jgi:hypothetical protein
MAGRCGKRAPEIGFASIVNLFLVIAPVAECASERQSHYPDATSAGKYSSRSYDEIGKGDHTGGGVVRHAAWIEKKWKTN